MIKITAFTEEDGTRIQIEDLSGNINDVLDETAAIVATVVMNAIKQGGPEGIRPKEFKQFILKEITKRMKEAVGQLEDGVAEVKESPNKIIEPKKKSIITKENGTNNGFLN